MRRVAAIEPDCPGVFPHHAVDRVGVRAIVFLCLVPLCRRAGSAPVVIVMHPTAIVANKALPLLIAHLSVPFLP